MFRRILVPTDGSERALKAVRLAAVMAREAEAEVILVTAVGVPQSLVMVAGIGQDIVEDYIEKVGRDALVSAEAVFREAGVGVEIKVVVGAASEVIVDQAHALGADVVIMGKRGLGELHGILVGSVSDRVAHRLTVPLLLVP
jgi:nucleotide-binding universal stress UspA family protein